jgi:uncharacterized protein
MMDCRPGCGACCIAPSISSLGKPAGVACRYLGTDMRCTVFDQPSRPACCSGLRPSLDMCGASRDEALSYLARLELATGSG